MDMLEETQGSHSLKASYSDVSILSGLSSATLNRHSQSDGTNQAIDLFGNAAFDEIDSFDTLYRPVPQSWGHSYTEASAAWAPFPPTTSKLKPPPRTTLFSTRYLPNPPAPRATLTTSTPLKFHSFQSLFSLSLNSMWIALPSKRSSSSNFERERTGLQPETVVATTKIREASKRRWQIALFNRSVDQEDAIFCLPRRGATSGFRPTSGGGMKRAPHCINPRLHRSTHRERAVSAVTRIHSL